MIGLLLPLLLAPAANASEPARIERHLSAMGTELTIAVEAADRSRALAASERAVRALEAVEARLSTWRNDSELARLNRAVEPFPLSSELAADLAAAWRCWEDTDGAFDPTVGALVEAWGLRRGGGRVPSPAELRRALAATGMAGLTLAPAGTVALTRPGLTLEEGGFGKGAGLAAALAELAGDEKIESAVLDLGGQVALYGPGRTWRVPVADPRDRQRPAVELTVTGGSVATSGNSERGIVVAGRRHGHLLDPRTGRPAEDFGSVTVWAEDPLRADCLSTGFFVLGPEAALERAEAMPGVEALVLEVAGDTLRARATPGLIFDPILREPSSPGEPSQPEIVVLEIVQ